MTGFFHSVLELVWDHHCRCTEAKGGRDTGTGLARAGFATDASSSFPLQLPCSKPACSTLRTNLPGKHGAKAGHDLERFPRIQTASTRTMGGKTGGTGWAPTIHQAAYINRSYPSPKRPRLLNRSSSRTAKSGVCGAKVARGLHASPRRQTTSTGMTGGKGMATG